MQKLLMLRHAAEFEGFDIAGACEPTTEIGGDCFTYFWLDRLRTRFAIVLMDVIGHGMKTATTTFLANGMLQSESRNYR
jgi:sigma-B regulation protein RsbU (phosphoserine phosphatase)